MSVEHVNRGWIGDPSPAPAASSRPSPAAAPSHREVAKAAFGYWQNHGGDANQNWLRFARQLVLGEAGGSPRVPPR